MAAKARNRVRNVRCEVSLEREADSGGGATKFVAVWGIRRTIVSR